MTPALHALIDAAWAQRYRDPSQLVVLGQGIVVAAGDDVVAAGWGWLHEAWGQRFAAHRDAAAHAVQQAEQCFAAARDAPGQAACRVLRANVLTLGGEAASALALMAEDDALPADVRSPFERQVAHNTRFSPLYALQRWDDALRALYAAVAAARETHDGGAIGHAVGLLGGIQVDLDNLDDALRLTSEGVAHAERADARYALIVASMNRLNALVALGRVDDAVAASERMLLLQPAIPAGQQEQAHIQFAWAFERAGRLDEAQALLDRSVALRRRGHLLEWTLTQAEICNARGRHAEARALCEQHLAERPRGANQSSPAEWLRLHQAAGFACEALGDLAAALAHQRAALALHAELVGRSARARRLTLEIEYELDRERWMRERAQAEQARLDQLNRALEAASLAKSRFLAAASHDLRQPVHALALQVAALRPHLDAPVQQEMAGRIERCVDALSGMFNTLLDLSQMDAGVVAPRIAPVALAPLLARLVEEQASVADGKGLRLALRVSHRAVQAVAASDAELLARALRNLVVNALKFTREGGVLMTLRPRGSAWRIEVWDTGIGIAAEERARVFDEFYQVDNDARQREQGLGLGLSIVQRLMHLLDHPLALHSRPGRGTRVAIELPAGIGAVVPPALPLTADASLGLHVALIEDDLDVRAALRSLLEGWGCRVSEADHAAPLLPPGSADAPDALLADLRLARGRSGLGEVAAMRAAWGDALPTLVISGDTAPERLRELQTSGLPWAHKPLAAEVLRRWLAAQAGARA